MVKNLLSLLNTRQNTILSGATILMLAVFGSRFLGLIRNRLLAHYFDTTQSAMFFGAFRIPELLFNLLVFGALSVAFIPVFTDYLHKQGEEKASEFASNILNLSLLVFGVISLIVFIFIPVLNHLIFPKLVGDLKDLTDLLTRIILVSQFVLVVGSFFVGIGQSHQRFIIPAIAPLFYNIGIIIGILASPWLGISGPALGVLFGAILHVLIQIPLIRSLGFKYQLSFNFFDKGVREIFKLMSVRNIGLIAEQLNDTISVSLASVVSFSSVTLLTYSQQLLAAPVGIFGATIAQAALPVLSREHSLQENDSFKVTLLTTLHQILFLTLPAAAILIVLRIPVVRLIFGASQFNWDDTVLTGRTVAFLSMGLAAQSLMLLLVRGFYALKDTKTPVIVSIIGVTINIFLSYFFINILRWQVWSLGISYAISTNLSFIMLIVFLNKKIGGFKLDDLMGPILKMVLAAVVSAIALYIPIKALDQLVIDTTKTINLLILTGIASIFGLSIYLILVWLMNVKELNTFVELFKKISLAGKELRSQEILEETGTVQ